jgi:anti-sigma-K factor RskA
VNDPRHCDRVDDAAVWVLRAFDEQEAAQYAAHLETCAVCRREVAELQWAADSLPASAPAVAGGAPPELGDRIMAVVRAEAALLQAAGSSADVPVGSLRPARERRSRWAWLPRPVPIAAAACALLLVGLGAGLLIGNGGTTTVTRTVVAQVSGQSSDAAARLVLTDGRGQLLVRGLHSPGAGRVYQVWLVRKGSTDPLPAGALFDVDDGGRGAAAVPADLADVTAVLVSEEPAGGSPQPTSAPIVQAKLS